MKHAYYTSKYFEDRDNLDLHIAESIKIFMEDNQLKKVLDVGCGTGRLVKFFNDNGFSAIGCDVYHPALEKAKGINKRHTIIEASAVKLPFKNSSFDLISAISVVEHLTFKEIEKFLREAYRTLTPRGYIFLITPNFSSPLRYILGKQWFGYTDPTHVTFFNPPSLSQLLQQHGFGNIKLRLRSAYNVPTDLHVPGLLKKLPMPLKNFLNYLMISSPLSTFRDSFLIAAQKKM